MATCTSQTHGEPVSGTAIHSGPEVPSETLWGIPEGRFADHMGENPFGKEKGLRTALSGSDDVSAGHCGCGKCTCSHGGECRCDTN